MKTRGDEKHNPLAYLFSKTWQYSQGNRSKVVWYWIMFIVANSTHLFASPLIMAKVINTVQKEGVTTTNFKVLLGLLMLTLLVTLVFWSLHGPARCIERGNAFQARLNYWRFLLKGVMTLPMEWHSDHHSGDTIDKSQKGTSSLFTFAEDSFMVIWGAVQLTVSLVMLFIFGNVSVVLIVLVMIALSTCITVGFDRRLLPQYTVLNRMENEISASVFDAISNIATVITLRVEKLVFSAVVHKMEKPFELFKYNQRLSEFKWFLNGVCVTVMTILVLAVYFWQNIGTAQGVLVGSVYLLITYLEKISELFYTFTRMYSDIVRQKSRVMNSEELSRDFKRENFTNHVLPKDWQRLDIENLNFSYHNDENRVPHLEDLSLSLERGANYAIVGKSGHGKSTFFKVFRDLYHPASGHITCDGVVIPGGFGGISRAIALVPQNPEIFATTILQNITMGAEHDMDFIRKFTDMACFTDVVEELPKKFDSSIKEKGVNLSGGQQQRLALARGLLACHDKDVVLLDEPTSSLDTATEMRVYRNIFREFRDKTVISSVHRLHLLPLFHQIHMFSGGRIIASGSLQDLLINCPEFQELWREYHEHREDM